ncbi:hypothetical protein [Paraburkholderia phosphatilytica]|uniref:hypothetical protein n=1 Tax=Paraburkholderia phosphatilytica TaxID=2282883 RepID=UPI000E51CF73|nr:hypothetical protein [Paraburkholderia phosphatilytica]
MPNVPASWEPYCHRPDAAHHLSNFASGVLGHDAGVIFFDGSASTRLKSARADRDGDTTDLVVSVCRAPLFPLAFQGEADPQTVTQMARQHVDGSGTGSVLGSAKTLYNRARAPLADFIESHKTAVDGVAIVADTAGVISGGLAVASIAAGGIALAPVLGVVAGLAALALLAEDGQMFYYEVTGNEVRKKKLANSWAYKLIETVAPILAIPDMAVGGVRAVGELPTATREAGQLAEEAQTATTRLADQRSAIDAYKEAHLSKLDQPNIMTKTQKMQAKANRLAGDVQRAQAKLQKATNSLRALRLIELPAYAASTYGLGVYATDPPDWSDTTSSVAQAWHSAASGGSQDPHHPAHALLPTQLPSRIAGTPAPLLQFHVGVRPGNGASR